MQRRRVSSGLNWNPHFMFFVESEVDLDDGFGAATSVYAISVGTLSEVIPRRAFVSLRKREDVSWGQRTVPTRPCLDDVDVVRSRAINGCHTYSSISLILLKPTRHPSNAPLYVVPKSTPTISLSCAAPALTAGTAPCPKSDTGKLPTLPNMLFKLCFLSIVIRANVCSCAANSVRYMGVKCDRWRG